MRYFAFHEHRDGQPQGRGAHPAGHPWVFRSDVARADGAGAGRGGARASGQQGRPLGLRLPFLALRDPPAHDHARRRRCPTTFLRERLDAALALARDGGRRAPRPTASCTAKATASPRWSWTATATTSWCRRCPRPPRRSRTRSSRHLVELLQPKGILERNDPRVRDARGARAARRPPARRGARTSVEVRENGVRFEADLWKGQKTGLFLDQRENHVMARDYARGRVLDAFTYNGGFALQVARAGRRGAGGGRLRGRGGARAAQRRAQRHRERDGAGGQRLRPAARARRTRASGSTP